MKVVTLNGTYEIDMTRDKIYVQPAGSCRSVQLKKLPSPIIGERMILETVQGVISTEPVTEVER